MAVTNAWILYRCMHVRTSLSCFEFRRPIVVPYLKLATSIKTKTKVGAAQPDMHFDGDCKSRKLFSSLSPNY